jgi:hypothetical protein
MANSDLILGVFNGKYTTRKLPKSYYRGISSALMDQVKKGIGGDKAYDTLLSDLNDNAQLFAAAKTYQLTAELQQAAQGVKSFKDFDTIGKGIIDKYDRWGEAEDNTALQQTIQAKQWEIITNDKDLFPILVYRTIGDACLICRPLDGLAAPVGSPIWRRVYPCNHYNCYCIVTQEVSGAVALTNKEDARMLVDASGKLMSPVFLSNPGITRELYTKEHPYFDVPKEDRKFAKDNFGLPIK